MWEAGRSALPARSSPRSPATSSQLCRSQPRLTSPSRRRDGSARIRMRPCRRLADRLQRAAATGCTTGPSRPRPGLVPRGRVVARAARRARQTPSQAACAHRRPPRRARRRFPPGAAAETCCGHRARCGRCSSSGPRRAASSTASACSRCWRRRSTGASCWRRPTERPSLVIKDVGSGLTQARASTGCRARIGTARRGPAGLRLRQVGGRGPIASGAQARSAEPRRRRRGHQLARSRRAGASATGACCVPFASAGTPNHVC